MTMDYLYYPNIFEEESYMKNLTETLNDEISPLHSAILDESVNLVEEQLKDTTININIRNKNFETPLLTALRINNRAILLEIVKKLLAKNPDINLQDCDGETPLHKTIRKYQKNEDDQLLQLILQHPNCNVNIKNYIGESPLHVVTSPVTAEKLIQHGADINSQDHSENTPLHKLVTNSEICEVLIRHGTAINSKNLNGFTPLHEAVAKNAEKTVMLLLNNGADPNLKSHKMVTSLQVAYHFKADEKIKNALWPKTNLELLITTTIYDLSVIPLILERWQSSAQSKTEIMQLLRKEMVILKNTSCQQRIEYGKVISRYFVSICPCLDQQFCSDFVRKFYKLYCGRSLTSFLLRTYPYTNTEQDEEKIFEILSTLFNYGDLIDYSDLEVIYLQLGDCPLLHMLLKVQIRDRLRKTEELPLFLKALCGVNKNLTKIVNNYTISTIDVFDLFNVFNLARYCTLPKTLAGHLSHSFNNIVKFQQIEVCVKRVKEDIRKIQKRSGIPTLLELSRNTVRTALCKKYKITKTDQLYSLLIEMRLPPVIADIIMMEFPIFNDISVVNAYLSAGKYVYSL